MATDMATRVPTQATGSRRLMARRANVGSFIGTTIEWFDFYAYSTAAALVLGPLFFPSSDAGAGTLAAFATFGIGFIARPLGGIIFGHLGDRIGRKTTLIITLVLMGLGTAAIGCLPTYAQIGIAAPILLVVLRIIQGIAMGGEWGGAVVLASEHAPRGKSILAGAWAQQGSPMGNLLATVTFMIVSALPDEDFHSWGWRIPFLASALLVVVGLFIRLGVDESPAMKELVTEGKVVKLPIVDVFRHHKVLVILGICACAIAVSAVYIKGTFALSWAVKDLHFDRTEYLGMLTIALIVQMIAQPFGAILASKIELRKAVLIMLIPELIMLPLMFVLIGTKSVPLAALGLALATIPHSMYYAALAGILAQSFPANVRYTGVSLAYQIASMIFAGTTPFVAQALLQSTGSIVSVIVLALVQVVITVVCAVLLLNKAAKNPETMGINEKYGQVEN